MILKIFWNFCSFWQITSKLNKTLVHVLLKATLRHKCTLKPRPGEAAPNSMNIFRPPKKHKLKVQVVISWELPLVPWGMRQLLKLQWPSLWQFRQTPQLLICSFVHSTLKGRSYVRKKAFPTHVLNCTSDVGQYVNILHLAKVFQKQVHLYTLQCSFSHLEINLDLDYWLACENCICSDITYMSSQALYFSCSCQTLPDHSKCSYNYHKSQG